MLKILNFFKSKSGETKLLTMRQRFEAAESEMNAVLADLGDMPLITIDAAARSLKIAAPDQFPDEALALPAPSQDEDSSDAQKASSEDETTSESSAADESEKAEKTAA